MRLTEFSSSRTQWHKHNKFPAQNGTRFHRTNQPETCHTRYDSNSNVLSEDNLLNSAYSQTFTYDPLNRLAGNTLGGVANQSWTLDSQGNWSSYTSNGTTQTQAANAQNQIASISGTSATPTYDASGNTVSMGLTTQPAGSVSTLVYDAWNRLVAVKNSSGQIVAQYTYSAMGYRVTESYPQGGTGIPAGEINYIYYNSQWQAIETRGGGTLNSDVTGQTVWSAAYINAAVLQDTYSGGVIQPGSRIYFQQDANWDTTAFVGLSGGTWQVTDRVVYSPYGNFVVYSADWSGALSNPLPPGYSLFQGMQFDSVTGLYYARNRNYDPSLGRWINQDPAGYINGANTYQFVESNPVNAVDPNGEVWQWLQNLWSLLTDAGKAAGKAAHYVPPSPVGEGLDACTALADSGNVIIFDQWQNRYSFVQKYGGNPDTDPLAAGLYNIYNGNPLTPQQQQAVTSWYNTGIPPPVGQP